MTDPEKKQPPPTAVRYYQATMVVFDALSKIYPSDSFNALANRGMLSCYYGPEAADEIMKMNMRRRQDDETDD